MTPEQTTSTGVVVPAFCQTRHVPQVLSPVVVGRGAKIGRWHSRVRGLPESFGELPRVALQVLGELQRDRAGEIAVLGLARLIEDHGEVGVLGRFFRQRGAISLGEPPFRIGSH